jgi:glycosyltransferase involved in cell wall biosynthesis
VRQLDPDLIHSSLFHANLAARLVGRLDRQRPLLTSTVTIETQRKWHLLVEALTGDSSDLHVANSEAVARHLRDEVGLSPERLRVIPNGLDFAEIDRVPPARRDELGLRGDVPLIVWAGRMDPVKNLETLIDVFAEVRRRVTVQLLLMGDGPQRQRIQTRVAMRGVQSSVTFAGWSENVAGWIKTADLLLLPSLTEGSPNVMLEAMACGCPVVASDVPGSRELITPHENGCLCCSGDVRCFAQEVLGLLEDEALRQRLAESALLRVRQRHDIQDVVVRWRSAYDRLISQPLG